MTNVEIIEQLENAIELIKQDGKDWLDDRDIPILEACIKALTALDNIRAEIEQAMTYTCKTEDGKEFTVSADNIVHPNDRFYTSGLDKALEIIDKYWVDPQAEKICDLEKSNFDVRQYKLDADTAYECGYNAGLQAQTDGEYVRKKDVMGCIGQTSLHFELARKLRKLPTVIIPSAEPKTGHWKRISMDKYSEHAQHWYECDKCGEHNLGDTNFCPNCGARMVEPQESED